MAITQSQCMSVLEYISVDIRNTLAGKCRVAVPIMQQNSFAVNCPTTAYNGALVHDIARYKLVFTSQLIPTTQNNEIPM